MSDPKLYVPERPHECCMCQHELGRFTDTEWIACEEPCDRHLQTATSRPGSGSFRWKAITPLARLLDELLGGGVDA